MPRPSEPRVLDIAHEDDGEDDRAGTRVVVIDLT